MSSFKGRAIKVEICSFFKYYLSKFKCRQKESIFYLDIMDPLKYWFVGIKAPKKKSIAFRQYKYEYKFLFFLFLFFLIFFRGNLVSNIISKNMFYDCKKVSTGLSFQIPNSIPYPKNISQVLIRGSPGNDLVAEREKKFLKNRLYQNYPNHFFIHMFPKTVQTEKFSLYVLSNLCFKLVYRNLGRLINNFGILID